MRTLLMTVCLALGLSGCATPGIERYRAETPALDLRSYFNGPLEAWGLFQGRNGEIKRRFHVRLSPTWAGDTLTLDEDFNWSDGTTSRRVWTLVRQADGSYRGTAADVVGEAVGEIAGNTLRWRYVLAVEDEGRTWNLDVDDWMVLMDEKVMLNRSTLSKWGFRVGEVILAFRKP